ncbi:hypothetical protein A3B51_00600 [Candidatus Curtissbacteria bacterium RIFCSPLOWO2_01_FULL_41_18]|uniref:Glycosyl transferase family 1 domain-containing protein n=1 Tax=Candidatus Curtissbacteria bacterium RIFCSPLOWO2_01_FULL_41_18 TaxID=1797727 RepID=A0A1F5HHV9_9BACT|nr:MAG: hypothetical protein A3B51_00600 [Candidatus Curtissbacteria bacterium RIFCSPLOWO2_01_FULL_41_18]
MIICSPQLGINPKSVLGGEVFDRKILLGLAKKKVKIKIILPKGKAHDKKIKNWQITFIPITHFPAILFNLIIVPYLFSIYRKEKFSIIRLHQPQFMGFAGLFFKLFHRDVKLVATYHQFRESSFGPFSKIVNNLWDHIICDSLAVKRKIVKLYKLPENKISIVHNGVPSYLKPSTKDRNYLKKYNLQDKIVLLFMGLFIERKNPLFLLDVLFKLSKTRSDLVLVYWGKGPLKTKIIQKAKKLHLSNQVRIIDPVFGPQKNKIHNLADIFVHPAINEGFALAPLEAMACAKPIVISSAYSAKEAVTQGINGFLCRVNDLGNWQDHLSELIEDSTLRDKMGKASVQKVKKEFQWSIAADIHFKIFKNLLHENI